MHAPLIRPASADDAALILSFIRELAAFENEPDRVRNTEEAIRREGFGERPAFEALIAEMADEPAGLALFYQTYSTWTGQRGLYLDDLYVRAPFRRQGIGEALIAAVAAVAVARGYPRLDLQVLHWNPARGLYERLGMRQLEAWLPYRAEGEALARLAGRAGAPG
jgi:ribosomal protein S18 acetylase RimI-like enzyme